MNLLSPSKGLSSLGRQGDILLLAWKPTNIHVSSFLWRPRGKDPGLKLHPIALGSTHPTGQNMVIWHHLEAKG